MQNLYDHPSYYDVLYGWDRDAEAAFYDRIFRTYGAAPGAQVLEIACGTGQIAARLAALGWQITGLDLRLPMLKFMQQRCSERGLAVHALCADMTAFALRPVYAAAYCPVGSFHLLIRDESAVAHLASVAAVLSAGAVYALDVTFGPGLDDEDLIDDWQMQRGTVTVHASHGGLLATDSASGERLSLHWGGDLRRYTRAGFARLIKLAGCFEIAAIYPEHEASDGTLVFDINHSGRRPSSGRAIVVLRSAR